MRLKGSEGASWDPKNKAMRSGADGMEEVELGNDAGQSAPDGRRPRCSD